MKNVFKVLLLVGILFIFTGCNNDTNVSIEDFKEKKKSEELIVPPYDTSLPGGEGIANTIKAYNVTMRNALLADPYIGLLRNYATEKETQRVFINIENDTLGGVAMRSVQKELVFKNISTFDNGAIADTFERWEFEYVSLETKKVVEPKKEMHYDLRYKLEKEGDKWVISGIEEIQPAVLYKQ